MNKNVLAAFLFSLAFFCMRSFAQDPGEVLAVETQAQADKAVQHFELTLLSRHQSIASLLQSEQKNGERLARILKIQPDPDCLDEHSSQNDRLLLLRLAQIGDKLELAMKREGENYDTWKQRYEDDVNSQGASGPKRFALYNQMVWSKARAKMLLILDDLFKLESPYHTTRIVNSCAVRRALVTGRMSADVETDMRKMLAEYDASTERFLSINNMYEKLLTNILGYGY